MQTVVGGGGFFLSRALANLAIDQQDKLPEAVQPYVGHLTNAALFAAAVLVPPKVKQLKDFHVPLVIGTGVALIERLLTAYAPDSVFGRVTPPVRPVAAEALAGDLDIYEAALSGMGAEPSDPIVEAVMAEAGMNGYVDTSALSDYVDTSALSDYVDTSALSDYVDTSMNDYVDTSALSDYVDTEGLSQDFETIGNYVDTSALEGYGPSPVAEEMGESWYDEDMEGYIEPAPLSGYGPSPVAEELGFDVYDTSLSGGIFGESGSPVASGTYPADEALESLGEVPTRRGHRLANQLRDVRDRLIEAGAPESTIKAALETTLKKATTPRAGGPVAKSYSSSGAESYKTPIPMAVEAPIRPMGKVFAGNIGGIFNNGIFS